MCRKVLFTNVYLLRRKGDEMDVCLFPSPATYKSHRVLVAWHSFPSKLDFSLSFKLECVLIFRYANNTVWVFWLLC